MLISGIAAMASCTSAAEKAQGYYSGSYAIDSTMTYPVSGTVVTGSINVSKVSDSKVDLLLTCNSPSTSDVSAGATVTMSGDVISFSYNNPTTTEMDMLSINGTIIGNTIVANGVMYMSGGNGVGEFIGTK